MILQPGRSKLQATQSYDRLLQYDVTNDDAAATCFVTVTLVVVCSNVMRLQLCALPEVFLVFEEVPSLISM